MQSPEFYMRLAYEAALQAQALGEVPVGAVLVNPQGEVVATGYNQPIAQHDPTAHAEIQALRQAAQQAHNYRLSDLTLFVTLEPCMMCMGAILQARLRHVYFAVHDERTGVCGSVLALHGVPSLNHQTRVSSGVLAPACQQLLRQFFQHRRQRV